VSLTDDDESFSYTARRLVDDSELDAILDHNITSLDDWRIRYPNHASWIREVIKSIKRDDYARLAFGVFIHGGENSGKLVCSAIVKKDHFGPYLEIKNLILLNTPAHLSKDALLRHKQDCYKKIIRHIQSFAESRGYSKLVTEVFNRSNDERELIQAFLRCGFDVSGSQSRRYRQTDEFIILSFEVDPVYGLDPYDFASATKWLVKRHMPEFEILGSEENGESLEVEICVNGEHRFTKKCVELLSHRRGPQSLRKFSSSCHILVIESSLASNNGITAEDTLEPRFKNQTRGRMYVFDFSLKRGTGSTLWERDLFPKIHQIENDSAYLDRNELNELLYGPLPPSVGREPGRSSLRVTADLPLEQVGGLLTLTDPKRLDGDKIRANDANGSWSIYIKLGPKGRTQALQGQILAFYFPSEDSSSDASIWGYAEITEVQPVNIDEGRVNRQQSDADVLFARIEDLQQMTPEPPSTTLWKPEQFEKHNKYNATNEVVLFYLTRFVDLRARQLRLETVVKGEPEQSKFRRKSIVKEIDAYISLTEAQIIKDHAGRTPSRDHFVVPTPPYRVQCVWSSPEDRGRIFDDGAIIKEVLSARGEYEVSPLAVNVNYPELKRVLHEGRPHLIHFCGHAESHGLVFAGSMDSWILKEDMLKSALAVNPLKPFLIVFNCCYSDGLAAAVSTDAFAIGFGGVLEDEHARLFPKYYLSELIKGFTATTLKNQLVDIVCGFAQETGSIPSLWFQGERVQ
jgi:hypothetical protein